MTHTEESLMALADEFSRERREDGYHDTDGDSDMTVNARRTIRLAIREVLAERDELRKDAERYRFLKTLEGQAEYIMVIRNKGAEYLDSAIDAALKDQP